MEELKKCPKCVDYAHLAKTKSGYFQIRCGCIFLPPPQENGFPTEEEMVDVWNRWCIANGG